MKIAIIGYGKMGKTIEGLSHREDGEVVLKIGIENLEDFTKVNLEEADVAIEFSRPEVAFENLKKCLEAGLPVVSGTTGWLEKKPEIEAICKANDGAFLYASNFSVGVNIFFAVNQYLAKLMNKHPEYDVEMEEVHHTQKLDAPSGTGITLANQIIENISRKEKWVNEAAFAENEVSLVSKRIDKVPGTHSIFYESPIDTIEIKHTAHSREGFAMGALIAAKWIIGKKGVFSMRDVLGF